MGTPDVKHLVAAGRPMPSGSGGSPPGGLAAFRQQQRTDWTEHGGPLGLELTPDPEAVGSLRGGHQGFDVRVTPDDYTKVRVSFRRTLPIFLAADRTDDTTGPPLSTFTFDADDGGALFLTARANPAAAKVLTRHEPLLSFASEWHDRIGGLTIARSGIAAFPAQGFDPLDGGRDHWMTTEQVVQWVEALTDLAASLEEALAGVDSTADQTVTLAIEPGLGAETGWSVMGMMAGAFGLFASFLLPAGLLRWAAFGIAAALVGASTVRFLRVRRVSAEPAWKDRVLRFESEAVHVPALRIGAEPVTIPYAKLLRIRQYTRGGRPRVDIDWDGGQLSYDTGELRSANGSFIDELQRRRGWPTDVFAVEDECDDA